MRDWVKQREKFESSKSNFAKRRLEGAGRKPMSGDLDQKVFFYEIFF